MRGGPCGWDPAGFRCEGEYDDAALFTQIEYRRRPGLFEVASRAQCLQASLAEGVECFFQSRVTPVQHVVVRQRAAIDSGRADTGRVVRVHPVVNALARPEIVAGGYTGLEIDDAQVRSLAVQFPQGIAPNIAKVDGLGNRPVDLFSNIQAFILNNFPSLVF